jgi:hypothetical protein
MAIANILLLLDLDCLGDFDFISDEPLTAPGTLIGSIKGIGVKSNPIHRSITLVTLHFSFLP